MATPLLLGALLASLAAAGFNNQARTPPMGWRSWNGFGCNISQVDIIAAARGLADTSRGASLQSLGYSNVGLDGEHPHSRKTEERT